nr:transposase [Streptomyces sp. SID5469]
MWDKGFDANAFLAAVHDTGARFLGRLRANRRTPVLSRLTDGSYLSVIGTVPVRVVEAQITVIYDDCSFTNSYRLVTTLTDARRYPAPALVALYHQRWEHESAYFALRHTITDGRVLRSGDPVGVEQEMWALLALYQALRTVMVEAAESRPGTDPDRCGFTIAIHTARDLVVQAADVIKPGALGTRTTASSATGSWPGSSRTGAPASAPEKSGHRSPGTPNAKTTAAPTKAAWSPTLTSPSSNPIPTCPPSRTTIDTHRPPTGADSASWTSFTQNPTASGTLATSPATSATSPSARCTDSSTDGP